MTRVSTFGNYQAALLDLMSAQNRGLDAQRRVATQKVADDLTGFGRGSEALTAFKSAQSRIQGFIQAGEAVAARLGSQDLALNRVADAAGDGRQRVAEALAAGRVDGLMLELEGLFVSARAGLNAKHQDRYLFAGANVETQPVAVATLGDLAAAPSVASVFGNDALKAVSRLDEGTTMETGFLANEVAGELFEIFRDIQLFHEGAQGPIADPMSDDVRDFLEAQLARFDAAHDNLTQMAARNGSMQNRVDAILDSHETQTIALDELIGERTDADMAKAVTDLQMSQIAVQASAQVISTLRESSLLYLLRS